MRDTSATTLLAGMSATNATLFHRIRFVAPDSSVIVDFADGTSILIVRDIEMDRARKSVRADKVCCAADFEPAGGLSGDRDTALAQAAAECLRRAGEIEHLHHAQKITGDAVTFACRLIANAKPDGIGLEVHEPILLDHGGGEIFQSEVFTVEPGLYSSVHGGVRVEDMVVVTATGHELLSPVPEELDWSD